MSTEPQRVEKYLTVTEAAAALSVCPPTVRKMIATGRLSAYRISPTGHYRIRLSEFNRLADSIQNGQPQPEPAVSASSELEQLLS